MSSRGLRRRFLEATGQSPGDWLTSERVAAARQLLCQGPARADSIAAAVGFGSAQTLRHHFRQRLGLGPGDYRARFLTETP